MLCAAAVETEWFLSSDLDKRKARALIRFLFSAAFSARQSIRRGASLPDGDKRLRMLQESLKTLRSSDYRCTTALFLEIMAVATARKNMRTPFPLPFSATFSSHDCAAMQRQCLVVFIGACCSTEVYGLDDNVFSQERVVNELFADARISTRSLAVACLSLYNCFSDVALMHLSEDTDQLLLRICNEAMLRAVSFITAAKAEVLFNMGQPPK